MTRKWNFSSISSSTWLADVSGKACKARPPLAQPYCATAADGNAPAMPLPLLPLSLRPCTGVLECWWWQCCWLLVVAMLLVLMLLMKPPGPSPTSPIRLACHHKSWCISGQRWWSCQCFWQPYQWWMDLPGHLRPKSAGRSWPVSRRAAKGILICCIFILLFHNQP